MKASIRFAVAVAVAFAAVAAQDAGSTGTRGTHDGTRRSTAATTDEPSTRPTGHTGSKGTRGTERPTTARPGTKAPHGNPTGTHGRGRGSGSHSGHWDGSGSGSGDPRGAPGSSPCPPPEAFFDPAHGSGRLVAGIAKRLARVDVATAHACLAACEQEDRCRAAEFHPVKEVCFLYAVPAEAVRVATRAASKWRVYTRVAERCPDGGCECAAFGQSLTGHTTAFPAIDLDPESNDGCDTPLTDQFDSVRNTVLVNRQRYDLADANGVRDRDVDSLRECFRLCVRAGRQCTAVEYRAGHRKCFLKTARGATRGTDGLSDPTAIATAGRPAVSTKPNGKYDLYNRGRPCDEPAVAGVCAARDPLAEFAAPRVNTKLRGAKARGKANTVSDCAARCLAREAADEGGRVCAGFSFVPRGNKGVRGFCLLYAAVDESKFTASKTHTYFGRLAAGTECTRGVASADLAP